MDTSTRNIWIGIAALIIIVVGAILIFRTGGTPATAPASIETGANSASSTSMTSSSTSILDTGATTPAAGTNAPAPTGFNQKG